MRRRLVWVAASLTCIVAVVLGVTAFTVNGEGRSVPTNVYCAILPDTIGLYTGNAVTRMGYPIGTISSITPSDTGVRVEFTVDGGRSIPGDVKAVTRSKSVLADRSLELVGDGGGPGLRPGDCIPITRAYTPKSISEIAGSAADLVDQIAPQGDTKAVQGSIDALSAAVSGTGPSAATLMRTAAAAAQSPEQMVSDIGSIIMTMAPLSGEILARWRDVESIITKLPASTDIGARVLWPAAVHMIWGMIPLLNAIYDVMGKYGNEVDQILDYLPVVIHIAASRVGDIQRSLDALPAVATAAALVVRRGSGAGVQVAAPSVRVTSADPRALCMRLNAARMGSCALQQGDSRVANVNALELVLAGVRR